MSEDVETGARKSTRRSLLKLARFAAGLGAGLFVLIALAFWRLSQGPVSLDFLTPALERALAARGSPGAVRIGKTILTWGGWRRVADLRMRNVRFSDSEGETLAHFHDLSVRISLDALLQRRFALSRIEVHGLTATVERFADGRFAFALPAAISGEDAGDAGFRDATDAIARMVRSREGPMRDLQRIAVVDARLRYIDRKHDKTWYFPQASFAADLRAPRVAARLNLLLELEGRRIALAGLLGYDRTSGRTDGQIDFRGVRPDLLARMAPELTAISVLDVPVSGNGRFTLARDMGLLGLRLDLNSAVGGVVLDMTYPRVGATADASVTLRGLRVAALARSSPALEALAGLDFPVDGRVAGRFDTDGHLRPARIDLAIGTGRIVAPGVIEDPLPVRAGRLRAEIAPGLASAEIQEAWLETSRARLSATAMMRHVRDDYRVRGTLELKDLGVGELGRYWPLDFAARARRWVRENISVGTVREAKADIALRVPVASPRDAVVETVDGGFSYEGLKVEYLSQFPPASGVGGTGEFDGRSLRFSVTEGHLRDVAIERGVIDLTGLGQGEARTVVELGLRGPVRTVLQVLDKTSLKFAKRAGVSPKAASGDAIIRTRIEFPLDEAFSAAAVDVQATARVQNVGLNPAPYGLAVAGGEIEFTADRRKFRLTGGISLGELPVSVNWAEDFGQGDAARRIELSGRVPDLGAIGFGLPRLDFVAGPANARVVMTSAAGDASEVAAEFDFAAAELSVPGVNWRKAPGEFGRATLRVQTGGVDGPRIDMFRVETGDTLLEGSAAPGKYGAWRVQVGRFEQPDGRLSGTVELRADRSIVANLHGDSFDLARLFAGSFRAGKAPGQAKESHRRIKIDAAFDTMSWSGDRLVRQAKLNLLVGSEGVEGAMLEGRTRGRGWLGVKYLPGLEGFRLDVEADDFGALLAGVLPKGRVTGGSFVLRGRASSADRALKGSFVAKGFTVRKAPTLMRLLQAASLTGVVDALSGKGLEFEEFRGSFALENGTLKLTNGRAFGPSIGITMRGDIDGAAKRLGLGGTLVPAYTFNRVIGALPLVGTLLTGGKGEGLFAAAYRVTGSFDKPAVNVNPLSALAPGFLRNLFGGATAVGSNADAAKSGDGAD